MPENPDQLPLAWETQPDPIDTFVITARRALDRPEVEYQIQWTQAHGRHHALRVWLDSCWRIDAMSVRIIELIMTTPDDRRWSREAVMATLNAVQSAYGCEEPF